VRRHSRQTAEFAHKALPSSPLLYLPAGWLGLHWWRKTAGQDAFGDPVGGLAALGRIIEA
jgi:hypothetical protein